VHPAFNTNLQYVLQHNALYNIQCQPYLRCRWQYLACWAQQIISLGSSNNVQSTFTYEPTIKHLQATAVHNRLWVPERLVT